ncbi:MAG: hypothetical protein C0467_05940 [Planctomycetaceae bacterium]|nr:hypothetical protein [Planctomycetaceae bacterium]
MLSVRNAVFLMAILVVASVASPEWGAQLVADRVQPLCVQVDPAEEVAEQEHMEVVRRELLSNIAIKDALITDLVSGRRTLAEVTEAFLAMNQRWPESMAVVRGHYPGRTDEEKTAHNVMGFVQYELANATPAQQAKVLTRLRAEFDARYPGTSGGE